MKMKRISIISCLIFCACLASSQVTGTNAPLTGYVLIPNSATGTLLNGPAKTTGNPAQAIKTSAGDVDARGICIANCGTSGTAIISLSGLVSCAFDGSVVAADWVQISATVAGQCHDAGATRPTNGKLLGQVVTTASGAGTYQILQSDVAAVGAVQTASNGLIDPAVMPAGVIAFPSGAIVMLVSGSCPVSFTEVAALNGKFLQGTLAANGDVGTTGGNATITPAGTVTAPVFTGTANQTTSAVSAGTPAGTNAGTAFTPAGTNAATATTGNCAATNVLIGTGAANACKATAPNLVVPAETFTGLAGVVPAETFTGTAMGTHTHTLTPAGTNSVPTFTGTAVDPRPAFTKVIFCSKN